MRAITLIAFASFASLSACNAPIDATAERGDAVGADLSSTATQAKGYELVAYAEDAAQLCDVGAWCLYGAFMLNTDYEDMGGGTPNTDYYDLIQGTVVEFAQSFDISLYDQFTFPDSIPHTIYDITNVHARFVCQPETFCDKLTFDMDGGNSSGMYLYYDWYTNRTSEIPGIFYGSEYGFEIFQPEEAALDYTPSSLDTAVYYPEVIDNKGQAIAVLRRYDSANFPQMTDFATGDAFFFLVKQ